MSRSHVSVKLKEEARNALQGIHRQDREAHLASDAEAASAFFDDPHIYVREGEIKRLALAEIKSSLREYFDGATFHEWDDLEPPIVHISGDASMAWMIVRLRIRYSRGEGADEVERTSVYAGLTTFEARDGVWVRVANASTFASE